MDMFTIKLNNNREYEISIQQESLTDEDVFHILRRMVFDMEQKRFAAELAGKINPNGQDVTDRIRKRLEERKSDS